MYPHFVSTKLCPPWKNLLWGWEFWNVPVAHFPNRELEDPLFACLESTAEIPVGEGSHEMILIVDDEQASASLTGQFHQLVHYQVSFLAQWQLILFLHQILNLKGSHVPPHLVEEITNQKDKERGQYSPMKNRRSNPSKKGTK